MMSGKLSQQPSDWFDRVIASHIDEVCNSCEEHSRDLYEDFITRLKEAITPDNPLYYEIENLFNSQIRRAVEKAYPIGIHNGMSLVSSIGK